MAGECIGIAGPVKGCHDVDNDVQSPYVVNVHYQVVVMYLVNLMWAATVYDP